tara:strand:- start:78 stop:182 length:105 start_codon:yes stop_codon:yes gene_type:complete
MNKKEGVILNGPVGIGILIVLSIGLGYYIGLDIF